MFPVKATAEKQTNIQTNKKANKTNQKKCGALS